jgi:dihydrolipoamide dehydrogenase
MKAKQYDVIVIGAGSAGYSFSFSAARLGMKILLVEEKEVGGTCLNRGCIPTKALLRVAKVHDEAKNNFTQLGITTSHLNVDFKSTQLFKKRVVNEMFKGLTYSIQSRENIELKFGTAAVFLEEKMVQIENEKYGYSKLVLATGREPMVPQLAHDSKINTRLLTSDSILELKEVPSSLTILGGGSIGCEFASLFSALGTKVTLLETMPHILHNYDRTISEKLQKKFKDSGVKVFLKITTKAIRKSQHNQKQIRIDFLSAASEKLSVESEYLLFAVGRKPKNISGIEEKTLLKKTKLFEEIYENVYCIGDILETPQLAHVAYREGIALADFIVNGKKDRINYESIPVITYSIPEVAMVGLTEDKAKRIYPDKHVFSKEYSFKYNGKAIIDGDGDGYAKMVFSEKRIVGVHLISKKASDLITESQLITAWEAEADDIARNIHPHPTESELYSELSLLVSGTPLHLH